MDPRSFPTKGNLILAKNSLSLAKQGFELMDKKRNILIRELMDLIEQAKDIQEQIDTTFTYAYECLQRANIENGINTVSQIAYTVPIEDSIRIKSRSIMGTEIPLVTYTPDAKMPTNSFSTTKESLDKAREAFQKVKELTIRLSMVETSAYRLATNIKKTPPSLRLPTLYRSKTPFVSKVEVSWVPRFLSLLTRQMRRCRLTLSPQQRNLSIKHEKPSRR